MKEEFKENKEEIKRANEELEHLFETTQIGFIVVDEDLKIKRFNKKAEDLFHLEKSDEEHFLSEVRDKLQYAHIVKDVKKALHGLKAINRLILGDDEKCYILKIEPHTRVVNIKGALLTFVDITELKRAFEDIVEAKNRLEREILSIEKKERWRIGQYLHDETAQKLVGIKMIVESVFPKLKPTEEQTKKDLRIIKKLVNESLNDIRELSHFVLPLEVGKKGVSSAFRKLMKQTEDLYHIQCEFSSDGTLENIENISAAYLYYISQEAIRNAIYHGEASKINVDLWSDEKNFYLSVKDNGKGYKESDLDKGMGINIMEYRAELLGGTLEIKQLPDYEGTVLTCRIPMEKLKKQ